MVAFWPIGTAQIIRIVSYPIRKKSRFWLFTCDPTKKCIMPSSRERHKGITGRGHDLRLNNPEPLTPSKLLLLRPNVCFHPADPSNADIHESKRWKQAQYIADVFWRRWLREYLPTVQVGQKWLCPRWNLKIGDLVLVIDESAPRRSWPKAVVQEVFPDRYGVVRQVNVRTSTAILLRDVRGELSLLEVASSLRDGAYETEHCLENFARKLTKLILDTYICQIFC